ncbi:MAG: hypothetical protein M3N19_04925, partial [Candidatus Eremiobacteraeota bacterium]|nr:hypothetical protein [Candidatus Eremiobacteraeota bacterium]
MSLFDPFLDSTRHAMMLTQEIVGRYGGECVDTEHIVLALLEVDESALLPLFEERGLTIDAYRERLAREPHGTPTEVTELAFSAEAKNLFKLAFARAQESHSNFVSDEHLLAALSSMPQCKGAIYLLGLGFDLEAIRARMSE